MKRTIAVAALLLTASLLFGGPQFRVAADAYTPVQIRPQDTDGWRTVLLPTDQTLSGWHWEVILNRLGFGMHYGIEVRPTGLESTPFVLDWKGDLFLSYHLFGGGSVIDPFVEIGWGNAGSAYLESAEDARYPEWEDRVEDGSATALALFTYTAAGLALDLDGLLVGARLSFIPAEVVNAIPDPNVSFHELPEFEFGLFAGIALGSHNRTSGRRDHRW